MQQVLAMLTISLLITLPIPFSSYAKATSEELVRAAKERVNSQVVYDGKYVAIAYPMGDVPANTGVCTDVIIRSYRSIGIDLQKNVHEDMSVNFERYPSNRIWGLNKPDTNIDHRRVPNLQTYFRRNGQSFSTSSEPEQYLPGDIVSWRLSGNLPHIGIVVDEVSPLTGNPLIVHNIGAGPVMDDILFSFDITGHYRYLPNNN